MSIPISYLIDEAANKFGDPNKTRVNGPLWLTFFNESTRELSTKADIAQYRDSFTLGTNPIYPFPDAMVHMVRLEVNEQPVTDPVGWRIVEEIFEDEWRARTSTRYPSATIPDAYFVEKGWFWLIPAPEAPITNGAIITYFGLPDRATDPLSTYQLPEFTQDYIIRRMVIHAKFARNRIVEGQADLKLWYDDVEGLQDKMDDRSSDRRSNIRPRRNLIAGMR